MGWSPAVIIVVRHGARLDAADKQWHLTSPTPYDPPLTYGGWTQSRALGARIASILRSRETDDEIPALSGENTSDEKRRKRRHKVIIHSSPFLRCVQTSIAISAGLAQISGHTPPVTQQASPAIKPMHSSPRIRPINTSSPALLPILEPSLSNAKPLEQPENIKKSVIRVDAFLGEWLSPDYFEQITPPPSSIMMVAGAKADLLRREDYNNLIHARDVNVNVNINVNQPFPGGWGSPVVVTEKDRDEGTLPSLSPLGAALPSRERTSSLSSTGSHGSRHSRLLANLHVQSPQRHGIYQPPVPSYAISSSDPIPQGYVAHARDACVGVDYQWDSMRAPQEWGNGGEYGEEWSQMHKRFRAGLQDMMKWYCTSEDPTKLLTKNGSRAATPEQEDLEDEDTDLVLILVTHGAGCNALIGALTNQPVLLDVGMASLTMAVQKPTTASSTNSSPTLTPKVPSQASSKAINISDQYEVKLVANTEHLRTGSASSTPSTSRAPSLTSTFRDRFGNPTTFDAASFSMSRPATANSNLGSIRRTVSVTTSTRRNYVPQKTSSIGLWSAPQPKSEESELEEQDDMILNFGDDGLAEVQQEEMLPPPLMIDDKENERTKTQDEQQELDADEVAPLGLWGAPKPPGIAEKIRELGPKRRWTINEKSS